MAKTPSKKTPEELAEARRIGNANLIPLNQRPLEERQAIAKKSQETRKANNLKRKALRETMEVILNGQVEYEGEKMQGHEAIMVALYKKALSGDVKAIETLMSVVGEKPSEKLEIKADVNERKSVPIHPDKLNKLLKAIDNGKIN